MTNSPWAKLIRSVDVEEHGESQGDYGVNTAVGDARENILEDFLRDWVFGPVFASIHGWNSGKRMIPGGTPAEQQRLAPLTPGA